MAVNRTAHEINVAHKAADARYPSMRPHTTRVVKTVFEPGGPCWCKDCPYLVAKRIIVNIWGTAMEVDVCEGHARLDGWCMDDLPQGPPREDHAHA